MAKKKKRIRWDRVAGTMLVLAAIVTGIILLAKGCKRESTVVEVTDLMTPGAATSSDLILEQNEPTAAETDTADLPDADDAEPSDTLPAQVSPARPGRIKIITHGPLAKVFNDSNHQQLVHARRIGIDPLENLADAYFTRRPIIEVKTNNLYTVDTLTHSVPFLVPEAEKLLRDIGKNFIDSLKSRGAGGYKIITTSLLRTPRHVRKLRRVNVNATEASTHQFATTFDISYRRFERTDSTQFVCEEDLKNLLGEVLYDLRAQGRCMVKYERKTPCFHITAIR